MTGGHERNDNERLINRTNRFIRTFSVNRAACAIAVSMLLPSSLAHSVVGNMYVPSSRRHPNANFVIVQARWVLVAVLTTAWVDSVSSQGETRSIWEENVLR